MKILSYPNIPNANCN